MIGDVNLFLKGLPDEEDFEAEVEIMIAGMLRRSSAVCFHAFDALTSELWTLTLVVLSPVCCRTCLSPQGDCVYGPAADAVIRDGSLFPVSAPGPTGEIGRTHRGEKRSQHPPV